MLTPFRSGNALIAWIDILGASNLSDDKLEEISSIVSHNSAFASGNSSVIPLAIENKVNAMLIGDAVCITQTIDTQQNRNFVATMALKFSADMFNFGYPNRGVLVEGSVRCGPSSAYIHGGSYITGQGIIKAYKYERSLDAIGILVSPDLINEAKTWSEPWGNKPFQLLKEENSKFFLTNTEHVQKWQAFVDTDKSGHSYVTKSKILLKKFLS